MHRASRLKFFLAPLFLLLAFTADSRAQAACSGGNVDLKVCGAVGDDAADDSPALQAAFDALSAAGGGTLNVPEGRYRLASPVSKNFLGQGSVIIRGHGSATVFHFASGAGSTNIAVLGAESLLVENLTFAGTPGVQTDAKVAFNVGSVERATFRRTDWYGVASAEAGGAVLWANQTSLLVENSSFRGCASSYWNFVPVVNITDWFGTKFSDTDFIDYGTLHGVYHSKTPQGALTWVYLSNPHSAKEARALFSRMFLDEGATVSIFTQTTPQAIISFEHIGANVNDTDSGVGLKIIGARHASVSHSYFGFASQNPRNAIEFHSVGTAVVEQTELRDKANRIYVDNLTKSLTISDSTLETLDADAEIITLKDSNIAALQLAPSSKLTTRSGGKFSAPSLSLGGGADLMTTNQTGTGSLVLSTSPTLTGATLTNPVIANPTITGANFSGVTTLTTPNLGAATGSSLALGGGTPLTTTNRTGTGNLAMSNSPTFVAPNLGAALATSLAVGGGAPLTTSAQTGTGNLVMSNSPTIAAPLISGRVARTVASLAPGKADPSVAAGDVFEVANSLPVSITNFRDGADGQLIYFVFTDGNTTVVDGPGIRLRGDFISKPDAVLILLRVGSAWFEISRSIDTKPFAAPKLDKAQPFSGKRT